MTSTSASWKSAGGGPQPDGVAGLHHVALNYPTRAGLAPIIDELDLDDLLSEPVTT